MSVMGSTWSCSLCNYHNSPGDRWCQLCLAAYGTQSGAPHRSVALALSLEDDDADILRLRASRGHPFSRSLYEPPSMSTKLMIGMVVGATMTFFFTFSFPQKKTAEGKVHTSHVHPLVVWMVMTVFYFIASGLRSTHMWCCGLRRHGPMSESMETDLLGRDARGERLFFNGWLREPSLESELADLEANLGDGIEADGTNERPSEPAGRRWRNALLEDLRNPFLLSGSLTPRNPLPHGLAHASASSQSVRRPARSGTEPLEDGDQAQAQEDGLVQLARRGQDDEASWPQNTTQLNEFLRQVRERRRAQTSRRLQEGLMQRIEQMITDGAQGPLLRGLQETRTEGEDQLDEPASGSQPPQTSPPQIEVSSEDGAVAAVLQDAVPRELVQQVLNRLRTLREQEEGMFGAAILQAAARAGIAVPASRGLIQALPTHQVTLDEVASAPEERRSCSICFEEFEQGEFQRTLPCFHVFHRACVDQWLVRSGTCPICKLRIDQISDVEMSVRGQENASVSERDDSGARESSDSGAQGAVEL